jgi:hypothetical protein
MVYEMLKNSVIQQIRRILDGEILVVLLLVFLRLVLVRMEELLVDRILLLLSVLQVFVRQDSLLKIFKISLLEHDMTILGNVDRVLEMFI